MKPIVTHKFNIYPNTLSLDSDVLIWYLREEAKVLELINTLDSKGVSLVCSIIVVLEVLRGMRAHEKMRTMKFLYGFEHVPVDGVIVTAAHQLFQEQQNSGITIPFYDSIIAATAIVRDIPLLTFNKKHYPNQILYPMDL